MRRCRRRARRAGRHAALAQARAASTAFCRAGGLGVKKRTTACETRQRADAGWGLKRRDGFHLMWCVKRGAAARKRAPRLFVLIYRCERSLILPYSGPYLEGMQPIQNETGCPWPRPRVSLSIYLAGLSAFTPSSAAFFAIASVPAFPCANAAWRPARWQVPSRIHRAVGCSDRRMLLDRVKS